MQRFSKAILAICAITSVGIGAGLMISPARAQARNDLQRAIAIDANDTLESLKTRGLKNDHELYAQTLEDLFCGRISFKHDE